MEGCERWMQCKRGASFAPVDYVARWKVYLDNSPPSSGEIDLGAQRTPAINFRNIRSAGETSSRRRLDRRISTLPPLLLSCLSAASRASRAFCLQQRLLA
jgi:hypothetical protein